MISPESRVSKKKSIPWRMIEEEAVLVDIDKGEVIQLDEVGARIWEAIDGSATVSGIIDTVCSEFEVDKDTATADVLEFLNELSERGAIYH
ncbi:MAG: PqqD family protein [Candidatus Omnitrophica bacterium]|nr:PqqD family protein [Candidatus Omnitrophota bacterium]